MALTAQTYSKSTKSCYNTIMNWNFSIGWFLFGVILLIAGILITVFYQPIADNAANGVTSYQKIKLAGIITSVLGIVVMANLHTAILTLLVNLIFKR